MTRERRGSIDSIEHVIETVLAPGRVASYNAGFGFVSDLQQVEERVRQLVSKETARAGAGVRATSHPSCSARRRSGASGAGSARWAHGLFPRSPNRAGPP